MRKYSSKSIIATIMGLVTALIFAGQVSAMTPTLSLSNNGYGSMTATVYADPNAPIVLDYYSGGQVMGAGIIGYTNYSGYFSGTINQSNYYLIPNGVQVFIVVNGQQSGTVTWQGYGTNYNYPYNNGTLTFSQTNMSLIVGQSQTVYINGTYNTGYTNQYYISSNLSNGIVSVTLNGNALTLYGQNAGSANITVCSNTNGAYYNNGNGCGTLYVTVTGSYYNPVYPTYPTYPTYPSYTYPLTVSNSNVQLTIGSTATISISGGYNNNGYYDPYNYNGYYGSSNYYILNNISGIASGTISGNTLTIYGQAAGSTAMTVCQTGGNGCVTVNVTVSSPYIYNNYYNSGYNYYNYNNGYPPNGNGNWYWNYSQNCWLQR